MSDYIREPNSLIGPFPQEPAFGSPAPVKAAADALRTLSALPVEVKVEAVAQATETIRQWTWSSTGMREVPPFAAVHYIREDDYLPERDALQAEVERLLAQNARLNGEVNEMTARVGEWEELEGQRDALAGAVKTLRDFVEKETGFSRIQAKERRAALLVMADDALRLAGRLP